MTCKKCLTENPEGATYCMYCGSRLDGTVVCRTCGTKCPDNAHFCFSCGAPLGAQQTQPKAQKQQTEEGGPIWRKVKYAFDLSGGICAIAAVFFALLFTFFIGVTLTVTSSSGTVSKTSMFWEYFGSAYKDAAHLLEGDKEYTINYPFSIYFPIALGTIVTAGTLISVITLAIISAVKYAAHFKNSDNGYEKCATATVIVYLLGASLIRMLNSAQMKMSGATIAGIVLSCVFLGLYFACKILTLGKALAKKKTIVNLVCILSGIVFTIVACTFAIRYAVNVKMQSSYFDEDMSFGVNFSTINTMIASAYESSKEATGFTAAYVVNILATLMQIALPTVGFIALIKRVAHFENEDKNHLGISIAFTVLAVVYLVVCCLSVHFNKVYLENFQESVSYSASIAAGPIVVLIMAIFNLAASIVHKVLTASFNQEAQLPAVPYYGEASAPAPSVGETAATEPTTAEKTDSEE